MRWQKILFITTAIALALAAAAPSCLAQIQQPPELLVRLWPFFRSTRPVPLLPQDKLDATEEGEPKKPLFAPFPRRKLDINSASFFELQNLPGIDSSTAAHIMAGRPYDNADDLLRDGIPQNVVQRLKEVVDFGP
jgi:DNA uptake protein ComE-like DNA-binding protein